MEHEKPQIFPPREPRTAASSSCLEQGAPRGAGATPLGATMQGTRSFFWGFLTCEPAEAAVTEPGVLLDLLQLFYVQPQLEERRGVRGWGLPEHPPRTLGCCPVQGRAHPSSRGRHPGSETFGDAAPAQANAKFPARNTIKEEVLPMQNSSGSSAGNKTGTAGAEPPPPTSPNRTGLPAPPKPPGSRRAQPQPCWCFSAPTRTQSLEHHPQKCFGAIHVPPNILFSENLSVWICGTATQPLRNLPVSSFYKPAPGRAVGLAARLAG